MKYNKFIFPLAIIIVILLLKHSKLNNNIENYESNDSKCNNCEVYCNDMYKLKNIMYIFFIVFCSCIITFRILFFILSDNN